MNSFIQNTQKKEKKVKKIKQKIMNKKIEMFLVVVTEIKMIRDLWGLGALVVEESLSRTYLNNEQEPCNSGCNNYTLSR